ncbi:MAG: hypothetical protein SFV54_18390 [Bryobacteraceae bacterium]|nr:hypothetical protein [Bryobacteraceae bacterium]
MRPGNWICALAAAAALQAASTTTWELNSYQDFLRGRFTGVSLSRDGRLLPAPKLETVFSSDQAAIWSVARTADGVLYLGTGHKGRVYRVDSSGKAQLYWTADEPEIFALAVDPAGVLYAATSPNGKIYRIDQGKATEYFAPGSTYIWSLTAGRDGVVYAGLGESGRVLRVTAPGRGEIYYETGQSHVTSLALDAQGRLLAGTEPNGILYRITGKDRAFVLYDANLPEIRAIVPAADGSIYAAALGGGVSRQAASVPGAAGAAGSNAVTATSSSITVTEAQAGIDLKQKPDAARSQAATPQVTSTFAASTEYLGVERSAVYRIHPDNTVETLWSSKEENAYDLLAGAGGVTFSTDNQGRIYRMTPDHKVTLLQQTNESETTRLLETPAGLIAATGNMGKLFRLTTGGGQGGSYESPVHDAGTVARWGRMSWRGDNAKGLRFRTRTGNSARPDRTWSEWSQAMSDPSGSAIASPNARYIQWAVDFPTAAELDAVTVAYLPQNTPPVLRSITVSTQASAAAAVKPAAQSTSTAPYSITVTDTGDAGATSVSANPTQILSRSGNQQISVAWQGEDSDGDKLLYSLYFRGEGEQSWKLLRAWITENAYLLDGDVLADGRYFFRVLASDRPNNPVESAREAELVSAPVLIDNTPPMLTAGQVQRSGSQVDFVLDASDKASAVRRAEYSVNAGPWTPVEAVDGVTDSPDERFHVRITGLPPGEHLIVARVFDTAGNAGLVKVVVR